MWSWGLTTSSSRKCARGREGRARRHELDTDVTPMTGARSSPATRRSSRRSSAAFPQDPHEQLWGAIGAVFKSWMNAARHHLPQLHDIPETWGTAVNVQAMVFGNMGDQSATGVAFTRNPSTGEKELYGEFLSTRRARMWSPASARRNRSPKPRDRGGRPRRRWKADAGCLCRVHAICDRLENHYRDMQDMEFTIQAGKLWMLQTRSGQAHHQGGDEDRRRHGRPKG
jgi:pyruvate,orthophosphate dikinase